jgi:co-chaperonin GroES (HSP10)
MKLISKNLLLEVIPDEEKSAAGLILPTAVNPAFIKAKVVDLDEDLKDDFKVGDEAYWQQAGNVHPINVHGKNYIIAHVSAHVITL